MDHAGYRLLLCTKLRCHYCGKTFLAPLWQTAGRVVDPPRGPGIQRVA